MMSIRKLVCKPKVDDWAPLAKFYYADENLNSIAAELDCFDGAKDPEKNQRLINQLRHCQDRIIQIIEEILNDVFPNESDRARRDYRVKFPDDIIHEGLAGQLWFGAECLSAGTNIVDRPLESESIRPLARRLCQQLDGLRDMLKEQSLKNPYGYPDKLKKHLRLYDQLFAEFELKYVSVMIPVKSSHEYDLLQDVCVLFNETLLRAIKKGFILQDMIDMCDPSIMITLPRLAIVCGLLIYPEGPLNVDKSTDNLAEMFQSFKTLLQKIRDLLRTLTEEELNILERALSSQEQLSTDKQKVALMSEFRYNNGSNNVSAIQAKKIEKSRRRSSTGTPAPNGPGPSFYKTQTPPTIKTICSTQEDDLAKKSIESSFDDQTSKLTNEIASDQPKATMSGLVDDKCVINDLNRLSPTSRKLRARFWSSDDLIHRLFVCIAGVADQWQTNYPADLRTVLKTVLHPQPTIPVYEVSNRTPWPKEKVHGRQAATSGREEETGIEVDVQESNFGEISSPQQAPSPQWLPDAQCPNCCGCQRLFTLTLRRHHCRNCGRIFCYKCSPNAHPLPQFGYGAKPVRVCNNCYFYKLNIFDESGIATTMENNEQS